MSDAVEVKEVKEEKEVEVKEEKEVEVKEEKEVEVKEEKKEAPPDNLQLTIDQVNNVVNGIREIVAGRELNEGIIFRVIANCMSIAARMRISNHLKKQLVIAAIERFIKSETNLSESKREAIMAVVDKVIDDAIDTIADVYKGAIDLSKKGCCTVM